MLGQKSEIIAVCVTVIAAIAAYTDFRRRKIHNWLTFPAAAAGLVAGLALGGWQGGLDSLLGAFAGLLLLGWMFPLGIMGAGDVKFLMALGAWGGVHYALYTAVLGVLVGGLIAAVMLAARKRKMPFGVPLAAAAIFLAWIGGTP